MTLDDAEIGKHLALIVKEALEMRLSPINIRLNSLAIEQAKLGSLKALEDRIEARLAHLEKLESRIKRLEVLGVELELHLAQSAGYNVGRGTEAVQ